MIVKRPQIEKDLRMSRNWTRPAVIVNLLVLLLLIALSRQVDALIDVEVDISVVNVSLNVCALNRQYKVGIYEEQLTWYQAYKACQAEGYKSLDRAGPLWQRRILMRQFMEKVYNFTTGFYWTDLFRARKESNYWFSFRQKRCARFVTYNMSSNENEHCSYILINTTEPLSDAAQLLPDNCYAKHSYACLKYTGDFAFEAYTGFEVTFLPETMYSTLPTLVTFEECEIDCGGSRQCTSFVYDHEMHLCVQYLPNAYYNEAVLNISRSANNVTFARKIGCKLERYTESSLNQIVFDETFVLEFPNCTEPEIPDSTAAATTELQETSTNTMSRATTSAFNAKQTTELQEISTNTMSTATTLAFNVKQTTGLQETSTNTMSRATTSASTAAQTTSQFPTSSGPSATASQTSTKNYSSGFTCACNFRKAVNISQEQLEELIDNIVTTLRVVANNTSSYRRTKTSAEDHRLEAKVIGAVGIFITISILCVPILLDLSSLTKSFRKCERKPKVKPGETLKK